MIAASSSATGPNRATAPSTPVTSGACLAAAAFVTSPHAVYIITDLDLLLHTQHLFDLISLPNIRPIEIPASLSFGEFKQRAFEEFGILPQHQRYWPLVRRQNKTMRPASVWISSFSFSHSLSLSLC